MGFSIYKEGVRISFSSNLSASIQRTKHPIEYKEKENSTVMLKRVVALEKMIARRINLRTFPLNF